MNAILFYKIYGFTGIVLYFNLKFRKILNIRLPDIRSIIHLRPGTSDREVFDQIFLDREYHLSFPFIPEVIVDGGANIGLTSVLFANKYPSAKIISIEPETSNFEAVVKNTETYENIYPIQAAIWNEPGQLDILDTGTGEWGFMVGRNGNSSKQVNSAKVKAITLQEVMSEFKFSQIDVLKVDIEGAEKELFAKNYQDWLPYVRCIIIEIHDNLKKGTSKTVWEALNKYDFSLSVDKGSLVFINENFTTSKAEERSLYSLGSVKN